MNVQLMVTCLGDVVRPQAGQAVVAILRRLGVGISFPVSQTCCGQPMFNSGYADLARQQAKYTIDVFSKSGDPVVIPSGSCAAMVKLEFPHLLEDEPDWHARAVELAARTYEFGEFLANKLQVFDLGAKYPKKVAYHYACHLRGLGLTDEHERLLSAVEGLSLESFRKQDQCCGFGGSFSIRYPQISLAMVEDKTNCLIETEAEVLVSTDTGCLMNIAGRLRRKGSPLEVRHLAEVLAER